MLASWYHLGLCFAVVKVWWNDPGLWRKFGRTSCSHTILLIIQLHLSEHSTHTLTSSKSIKPLPSVSLNWVNCSRSLATQSGSDGESWRHRKYRILLLLKIIPWLLNDGSNVSGKDVDRSGQISISTLPCSPSSPPSSLYISPMYSSMLTWITSRFVSQDENISLVNGFIGFRIYSFVIISGNFNWSILSKFVI